MLRRDRQLRMQVSQWMDGGLFAIGLYLAYWFRADLPKFTHWVRLHIVAHFAPDLHLTAVGKFYDTPGSLDQYLWLFLLVIPLAPLVLESQGFYKRTVHRSRATMIWQLFKGSTITTIGLVLALYLFKSEAARGVMLLVGIFGFAFVYLKEELLSWENRSKFGQSQSRKRVLLLGTGADTHRLRLDIERSSEDLEVVGELDLEDTPVDKLVSSLHEFSVNGVILTARHTTFKRVEEAIQACELEGVEAWLLANFFQTRISRTSFDDFYGQPVLVFHGGRETAWRSLAKRVIDVAGALVLILLFTVIPILPLAALLVKLSSRGPIFFRQQRSGLNGQPFVMYKFRTMVTNAEQLKHELASLNEMSGPVFKVTNDPRVTKIGRWLRKKSIDEFPQLLNVLRGEMSLVGPRPLPVDEVARFDDLAHRRRLSVKPGLTCLWQVSGRNDVSDFKEWVRLDLEYIDNWSLWLDFKILWLTIPVVLLGKGAK